VQIVGFHITIQFQISSQPLKGTSGVLSAQFSAHSFEQFVWYRVKIFFKNCDSELRMCLHPILDVLV